MRRRSSRCCASDDEPTVARAQAALAGLGEPGRVALERALATGVAAEGARAKTVQAVGLHARRGDAVAVARLIAAVARSAAHACGARRSRRSASSRRRRTTRAPRCSPRWDADGGHARRAAHARRGARQARRRRRAREAARARSGRTMPSSRAAAIAGCSSPSAVRSAAMTPRSATDLATARAGRGRLALQARPRAAARR